jgi:hypothetical protein
VDPIKQQLAKFVEWQEKVKNFKQQEVRGMINMDARSMKGKLEKFLRENHMALREHAFKIGDRIAYDINQKLQYLQTQLNKQQFSDLSDYVNFTKELAMARDMAQ